MAWDSTKEIVVIEKKDFGRVLEGFQLWCQRLNTYNELKVKMIFEKIKYTVVSSSERILKYYKRLGLFNGQGNIKTWNGLSSK